jgi:putative ABC transport system permease protein
MKTARRAIRTLIRSPLRSALVMAVLTVSVGLTLIMITVNQAFAKRLDDIKGQAGTTITVRPAGTFGGGFFGGGGGGGASDPGTAGGTTGGGTSTGDAAQTTTPSLTTSDVTKLLAIPSVAGASSQITVRYSGTDLTPAQPQNSGTQGQGSGGTGGQGRGFRRGILITGTDNPAGLTTVGTQDVQITSGRTFTADEANQNVAVMGQALAQQNNLSAGGTFPLQGATFQLVGTFTTGTQFGDNSIFIPLQSAQTLFQRPDSIDSAVVQATSVDQVNPVADSIRTTLGANNVDVTTELSTFQRISAPLSDAKNSSRIGMIVALAASAAVILFSIGLVARQRIKEIGILKAVGASGWHVTGQFAIETAVISIFAALIGALATYPLAQTVANGLVSQPARTTGRGAAFAGGRAAQGFFGGTGSGLLGNVGVAVSPDIFVYALGIAICLAVIATVVPAWYVGRVKPAAVLRHE